MRRVLITRPQAQAERWQAQLREEGLDSVCLPMLDIAPLEDAVAVGRIKTQIQGLDENRWLIFVSQNAVQHGFDWIERYWPQFPLGVTCFGIGAKTHATLLERLGALGAPQAAEAGAAHLDAGAAMDSEALLRHPALQQVRGEKILICRGCGGRTHLFDVLSERGARVSHCELYARRRPEEAQARLRGVGIDCRRDIAALFSGETLSHFSATLTALGVPDWPQLTLIVPSARVAEQAQTLGFRRVVKAANASEAAMGQALRTLLNDNEAHYDR